MQIYYDPEDSSSQDHYLNLTDGFICLGQKVNLEVSIKYPCSKTT